MYSIIDIETTGGKFREEKIIEIAIYNFDGQQIVDSFSTLINPQKEIHFFVSKLTGITHKMVKRAPKFHEVAKRIIEMCDGNTIVAHNAEFDYRMLQQEFLSLGYTFQSQTLCTIDWAKKLIPNQESYSLGKLCKSLGIPLLDAHRAYGDAKATVDLLQLLLQKDIEKKLLPTDYQTKIFTEIPSKLNYLIDDLPMQAGVYYFHNAQNQIIYVGKSINIKNRVRQHFTSQQKKSIKIQQLTTKVTFEITGSELIALIKESIEIKALKPIFNIAQRKTVYIYGLYNSFNEKGYLQLSIEKIAENKTPLLVFTTLTEAKNILFKITDKYTLCQKINSLHLNLGSCFAYKVDACLGACIDKELPEEYNIRVKQFIQDISNKTDTVIYQDKGRKLGEKSFIVIKNGTLMGYGFYMYNYQINTQEKLLKRMNPVIENQDIKRILKNYF